MNAAASFSSGMNPAHTVCKNPVNCGCSESRTVSARSSIARDATTGTYTVDPDGTGPAAPFSFADPNFSARSLRGTAVLRWEYRPGSTLYFAWTQQRSGQGIDGKLDFSRDQAALWRDPADNVFLVKVNYWLGR